MKQTPFTEKHIALGAKMADFAGFNMPISYSGIKDEHATVRNNAGVFDVSHMGTIMVKGPKALDLIQYTTSNDAAKLNNNQAQYTCFTNENGGIIDDFIVYCLEKNQEYMLVVNASNVDKDWDWLVKHNKNIGAELENISSKTGILAIQGPKALEIIQELTPVALSQQKYFHFEVNTFAGVENVIISATGYTGSGGVEIYFENKEDNAEKIWTELFKVGEAKGLKPIGLGARDTLRLEKGFCLYGNELNESTNTIEAGLGWVTKFSKDFIGKEVLEKIKAEGAKRKLVGIELIDRGIPRTDYSIVNNENEEIGIITSGTQSPSLGKAIAMGYIHTDYANPGTEIAISIRNKAVKAKVVRLPFL